MTVASRPTRAAANPRKPTTAPRTATRANMVEEIAARRRFDVLAELAGTSRAAVLAAARTASSPRPIAERLAAPGLHLIAELKRASPSAGPIAADGDDLVARARAYEAGGAAAISVLCEPHWFGGSLEDLRAVRAAVALPVLAKEFVVEEIQLPMVRAAGADLVLLLAVLHPARRLARLVGRALELGLEPLVEVHDPRELERALGSGARIIGLNNRDLRSLEVDLDRAARLRELVPDDRLVIAESGVREPATVARWRALGFDGALVGEALVRAAHPAAAVAAFVAAGRAPDDLANLARRPLVKICGVTDADGALSALRADADAIGLNVIPGTPRALDLDEAATLARLIRSVSSSERRPLVVAVTADAPPAEVTAIIAAIDPDVVQLNGAEPIELARSIGRRTWKVLHLPATEPANPSAAVAELVSRGRAYLAGGVERLLLDTAGGPHPGGTGVRVAAGLAGAVARELPVILAGGLDPAGVAAATRAIPAVGVDVASGVERPRRPGRRPVKDPLRVALFVKRARAARDDRPNLPFGPTPIHPGLLDADGLGRWGMERDFGGRYVPETLMAALEQLERAYADVRGDPVFWAELRALLADFAGRPTALYRADRLAGAVRDQAERLARVAAGSRSVAIPHPRLYLKREDLAHTGAHKINNALGQALLTRRLGKTRVIAETGAGQHGVATATACALLDLPCVVYMGAEDIERQGPNVLRMRALGAEVRPVTSGTATLKDAVNEAMRDWVTNVQTTHYVLGSAMGPHPYPTIVRDLQRRIGDEAAAQLLAVEGRLPDLAIACVGGGSNAIGLLTRFIGEPGVRLAVVEAAGDGIETGHHAAAILGGSPGILHGSRSLMLQDADGQVTEAHSASAGLDYPGIGPHRGRRGDRSRGGGGDAHDHPDRRDPARARDGPCGRRAAEAPRRRGRARRGRAGRPARARRLLRARRQGPGGARAIRRRRTVGGRQMTPPATALPTTLAAGATGTNGTAGARRIAAAFARARADGRAALIPYVVAGYPDAETSFAVALAAADAGADLLEVGLPYSDPLADGATLQRASGVALAAGATLERSLRLIERIGAARPDLPLVPMGYANQVIGGGDGEAVARRLAAAGAAGLIVADLTPDEGGPFEAVARASDLAVVYLVAPTTSPARRAMIAARSGGFLYCVSLVGVTGARRALPPSVGRLVRDVRAVSPVPVAVGFGVSRPGHVRAIVRAGADGVIVASALVDALGPDGRDVDGMARLVEALAEATRC